MPRPSESGGGGAAEQPSRGYEGPDWPPGPVQSQPSGQPPRPATPGTSAVPVGKPGPLITFGQVPDGRAPSQTVSMKALLDYGMSLLGTPYVWGSTGGGLDCSGLIRKVFNNFGVNISGVSYQLAQQGLSVRGQADALPGDLIGMNATSRLDNQPGTYGIDHIGIYLGNGLMLVSPHTGAQVRVEQVSWAKVSTIRRVVNGDFAGLGGGAKPVYTPPAGASVYGSSVSQVAAEGGDAQGTPKNLSDDEIRTIAYRDYGYLAAYLDHPELGPILLDAARRGLGSAEIQGKIAKTKWYTTNAETARAWDAQSKLDPATYRAQLGEAQQAVRQQAARMGVTLNNGQVNDLATKRKRLGWSDEQIVAAIAGQFRYAPDAAATGQAASAVGNLKALANAYAVDLAPQTIQTWTSHLLGGTETMDSFRAYLTKMAKSRFSDPDIHAALDRGDSIADYFEPYRQDAARLLELNPESIDLNDPTYLRMLDQKDPATGRSYSMTRTQAQDYLRGTDAYGKTHQARAAGGSLATGLLGALGKVA